MDRQGKSKSLNLQNLFELLKISVWYYKLKFVNWVMSKQLTESKSG